MAIRRTMIFALCNLINNLIYGIKNFITSFSLVRGTTFEAESCLNTDLTELDSQRLLGSSNFILKPNNYSETSIVPVRPLPNTDLRNLLWRTDGKLTNWSNSASTAVVDVSINDPLGGLNTIRVTETATTAAHNFNQGIQNYRFQFNGVFTFSVYLRKGAGAGAPDIIQLSFANNFANFNISTGVVTTTSNLFGSTITNVGSGWWRCTISGIMTGLNAGSSSQVFIGFVNNSPTAVLRPSYLGATNRDVYVFGAQFELSTSATNYQRNDLYPQLTNNFGMFLNTTTTPYWTNSRGSLQNTPYENIIYPSVGISSVQQGQTWRWISNALAITITGLLAPNGTLTGSRINLGAGNSRPDYYMTYQTSGNNANLPSFPIPKIRTLIVFVKQDSTDRYLGIKLNTGGNTGEYNTNSVTIKVDCSNGTLANNPTAYNISYSSQFVGNGWYKICINSTTAWDSFLLQSSVTLNTVNNTANAGVLIWGVQVVDGVVGINTTVYNRELGFSIPRLDYSTGSCPDHLIETSNFNTLLQSENFTSANWIKVNSTATTSTFLGPDENSYSNVLSATGSNAIIRQSGSANTTARQRIFSVYLQRRTGTGSVRISMGSITSIVTLTNSWQRYFVVDPLRSGTYTSTSGNFTVTTSVAHGYQTGDAVFIDFTTGGAVDNSIASITVTGATTFTFTLGTATTSGNCTIYSNTGKILIDTLGDEVYAWGAQIESTLSFATAPGRVPSSYIPTTTTQVTRAGDFFGCNLNGSSNYSIYAELSRIGGANTTTANFILLGNETTHALSRDSIGLAGTLSGNIIYSKKENGGSITIISNPLLYSPVENRSSKVLFTISGTTLNLWMDGTLINTTTFATPSNLRYFVMDNTVSSSTTRLSEITTWPITLNNQQAELLTYNPYFPNGTTELTFLLGRARASSFALPSDSTLQALDIFIATIKASGIWDKMDAIYNFAYNDTNVAAFSRLNLKNTLNPLGTNGTMTYQTNGYLAGAGSSYLTGYRPGTSNVQYQPDAFSRTHILYQAVAGARIDANTINDLNDTFYNSNTNTHRALSNVNLPQSVDMSGTGLKSIIRNTSASVSLYNQSTGVTLAQPRSGTYGASQQFFPFGNGLGVGFTCFGAPLTQTDINTLRTAYNTYLSAIGLTQFA